MAPGAGGFGMRLTALPSELLTAAPLPPDAPPGQPPAPPRAPKTVPPMRIPELPPPPPPPPPPPFLRSARLMSAPGWPGLPLVELLTRPTPPYHQAPRRCYHQAHRPWRGWADHRCHRDCFGHHRPCRHHRCRPRFAPERTRSPQTPDGHPRKRRRYRTTYRRPSAPEMWLAHQQDRKPWPVNHRTG